MTQKDNKNDIDLGNLDDINLDDINLDDIDLWDDFAVWDSNIWEDNNIQKLKELVEKWYITSFVVEKIEEEIKNYDKSLNQAIKDVISSLSLVDLWEEKENITEENKDEYINWILDYIDNWNLDLLEKIVTSKDSEGFDNSDNEEEDLWDISLEIEENENESDVEWLDMDLDNEEDTEEFGDIAVDLEEDENNKEESEEDNLEIEENISDEVEEWLEIELDSQEDQDNQGFQENIWDIDVEENELTEEKLSKLTKAKLMEKLDELWISYDKKLKKAELISLILWNANENIEDKEQTDDMEENNIEEWEWLDIDLDEDVSEEDSESDNEEEQEVLDKEESEEEFWDISVDLDEENDKSEWLDIDLDDQEEQDNQEIQEAQEEIMDLGKNDDVEWWEDDAGWFDIDLDEEVDTKEDTIENQEETKEQEIEEEKKWSFDIDLDEGVEQDDNEDVEKQTWFDLDNVSGEISGNEWGFNLDEDIEQNVQEEEQKEQDDNEEEKVSAGVGLSLDELASRVENSNNEEISQEEKSDVSSEQKKQPRIVPNPEAKRWWWVLLSIIVLLIWSVFWFSYVYFSYPELLWLDNAEEQQVVVKNNTNLNVNNVDTWDVENDIEEWTWDNTFLWWETNITWDDETWYIEAPDDVNISSNIDEDEEEMNQEDESIKKQVADLIKEYYWLLKNKIDETDDEEEITALKKKTALLKTILKRVIKIDEENMTDQDEKYLEKIKVVLEKKIENLKNE